MKFNLIETLKAGLKGILVVLITVLIGALTLGLGFSPADPLSIVVWKYGGVVILGGIINALRNALTHLQ